MNRNRISITIKPFFLSLIFVLLFINRIYSENDQVIITGSLFCEDMDKFGITGLGVNPFFAYWKIVLLDKKSEKYTQTLDVNGHFSINVPKNNSYMILFLDSKEKFQFALAYKPRQFAAGKAPLMIKIKNQDKIDLGIITKFYSYSLVDDQTQNEIEVDPDWYAFDENENLIPDGLEFERRFNYNSGKLNLISDLDNDGILDDADIDIDGDGIPNIYDTDVDEDGLPNEEDPDNTNDGIKDNIGPIPPEIKFDSLKSTANKGQIIFNITIYDENADPVSLKIRYSSDSGKSFNNASLINTAITDLKARPEGIKHKITWNTITDIGYIDLNKLIFEITPFDKDNEGTPAQIKLNIRNNTPPVCKLISPSEKRISGYTNIKWKIIDNDPGQQILSSLFFTQDNTNYVPIAENLAKDSFKWDTAPLGKINTIKLKVIVSDLYSQTQTLSDLDYSIDNPESAPDSKFIFPDNENLIFSDKISVKWFTPEKAYSSLYHSSDGMNWTPIETDLETTDYLWDISGFKNTENIRLMLKTKTKDLISYSFSKRFIIKNINHPPQIEVICPKNNSTIGDTTVFKWKITDIDPADKITKTIISVKNPGSEKLLRLVEFDNDPGQVQIDLASLKDNDGYTFAISASDQEIMVSQEIKEITVSNPPYLKEINVLSGNQLILSFSKQVNNLFLNTEISGGIKIVSMERLNDKSYKLTISPPLETETEYTLSFKDGAVDASGNKIVPQKKSFISKADKTPPEVTRIFAIDYHLIDICFSEEVINAQTITNYIITPQLKINSVIELGGNSYRLVTANQKEEEQYSIGLLNITDKSGNRIVYSQIHTLFTGFNKNKYIKVDLNGHGDYTDIDSAVSNSLPGSIILISGGTYPQINSILYHPVTLWGGINPQTWLPDKDQKTVIKSNNISQNAITSSANARIINLDIKNGADGIRISSGYNFIYGCRIYENKNNGITIAGNSISQIANCIITKNGHNGIGFHSANPSYIFNNVISDNVYHGIEIFASSKADIFNNIIMLNEYGISIRKTGSEYPQIRKNCFFKNNHGKSLDSSYAIFCNIDETILVVNDESELNRSKFGWEENFILKPKWKNETDFILQESSSLINSGNTINLDFLPKFLSATINAKSPPVGTLQSEN